MTSPARLTWLHLSDFHLREKLAWSQDAVLKTLVADISARYGKSAPDLLFLTGDIAFSGKPEEYGPAEDFVRKLASVLGLGLDRLFLVPGNHDINRDKEEDAFAGARLKLKTAVEVDRFLGDEGRRRTLFARQRAFRDFANRLAPGDGKRSESSFVHCRMIRLRGLRIRVMMLDSTWLSEGGEGDSMALLVGERQVLDCAQRSEPDGASFTFALMHHPFAWLCEFEQGPIENLVIGNAQICLRGHVHATDQRAIEESERRLTTFTAGAAFQNRTADNSYLWCSLDLVSGRGEKIEHRYRAAKHKWDANERVSWNLLGQHTPPVDAAFAWSILKGHGLRHVDFLAALAAGLVTEVPQTLPGGKVAFVSCEAAIPGGSNRVGELIRTFQNVVHWKPVWEAASWDAELRKISGDCDRLLTELERAVGKEIEEKSRQSKEILCAVVEEPVAQEPVFVSEVRALLADGSFETARTVLERWSGQEISAKERLWLKRLAAELLSREERQTEALAQMEIVLTQSERTLLDVVTCARCALRAKSYKRAAVLIHQALDEGIAIVEVKDLALKVAGLAGDGSLTKRVMQ